MQKDPAKVKNDGSGIKPNMFEPLSLSTVRDLADDEIAP